jgi:hypothetical protein
MRFLLDTNVLSAQLRRPARLAHRFFEHSGKRYGKSSRQQLEALSVQGSADAPLAQAHVLCWSQDAEDRALVDARILTRERDAQIARRLLILPAAVRCYEALFFHVRDRFQCSAWIMPIIRCYCARSWSRTKEGRDDPKRHTAYASSRSAACD